MKVVSGGRRLASWSLALAMLSAQADTWYLKSDVTSGSYPATTGDNAGSYWKNVKDDQPGSGPLNPEDT